MKTASPDFAARLRPHATRVIAGDLPIDDFRAAACGLLLDTFAVPRASLWRMAGAPGERRLVCVALRTHAGGAEPAGATLHEAAFGAYIQGLVRDGVYRADDVHADPNLVPMRDYLTATGVRALLDTCFQINGQPFGVLCLEETRGPRQWTPREVAGLRQAAASLSLTVARLPPGYDFGVS